MTRSNPTDTAALLLATAGSWLSRAVDVRPDERTPLALAFATFFAVLSSYFTVRPLREAMGASLPDGWLEGLFTVVFVVMVALVPVYGAIVATLRRHHVLPAVYLFFIANLVVFALALGNDAKAVSPWVASAFFVWVSVYNLFIVSLFWSLMADRFSSDEGKRLFGVVSAGGTLGAFLAPALVPWWLTVIDTRHLPLVAAAWLGIALALAAFVAGETSATAETGDAASKPPPTTLANVMEGATSVLSSPYLFRIALWILLANLVSTYFYLEQSRLVKATITDAAEKVRFFAWRDQLVAIATIAIQLLGTAAILKRFGVVAGLLALPIVCVAGLVWYWLVPTLSVVAAIMTIERITAFGLSTPATKVLYTVVTPDEKYKAQSFVDTVVYRGGDAASGWLLKGLSGLGASPGAVAIVLLPLSALWVWSSLKLGRLHEGEKRQPPAATSTSPAPIG